MSSSKRPAPRPARATWFALGGVLLVATALSVWALFRRDAAESDAHAPVALVSAADVTAAPESVQPVVPPGQAASAPSPRFEAAQPTSLARPAPALPSVLAAPSNRALRVVVVDVATQEPVPDADVRVALWRHGSAQRTQAGLTDASGVRTFHVEPATYSVVAFRTGAAFTRASVDVLPGEQEHELRMELDAANTLRGVVVDEDDRPIAGVSVRNLPGRPPDDYDVTTDTAGRFGLPWWLLDGASSLRFERNGYGSERLEWDFEGGEWWYATSSERARFEGAHAAIRIVLRATRRVSGVVVDGRGAPVLGARVGLSGTYTTGLRVRSFDNRTALTGVLGRFAFEALRVDAAYDLVARQDALGVAVHRVAAGGDVDVGALALVAKVPVTGRVIDGHGVPVLHASVTLRIADAAPEEGDAREVPAAAWSVDVDVDADGRFEVEGAALPGQRLELRVQGAQVLTRELDLSDGGVDLGEFVVVQGVHAFSGIVLDLEDEPMDGLQLHVRDMDGALVAMARTDVGGHFTFCLPDHVERPGLLQLKVQRAGLTMWPTQSFAPSEFPITLRADRHVAER